MLLWLLVGVPLFPWAVRVILDVIAFSLLFSSYLSFSFRDFSSAQCFDCRWFVTLILLTIDVVFALAV